MGPGMWTGGPREGAFSLRFSLTPLVVGGSVGGNLALGSGPPLPSPRHFSLLEFHTLRCIDGCECGDDGQESSFSWEAYDG